jgi:hypothetical protein
LILSAVAPHRFVVRGDGPAKIAAAVATAAGLRCFLCFSSIQNFNQLIFQLSRTFSIKGTSPPIKGRMYQRRPNNPQNFSVCLATDETRMKHRFPQPESRRVGKVSFDLRFMRQSWLDSQPFSMHA